MATASAVQVPSVSSLRSKRQGGGPDAGSAATALSVAIEYPSRGMKASGHSATRTNPSGQRRRQPGRNGKLNDSATWFKIAT